MENAQKKQKSRLINSVFSELPGGLLNLRSPGLNRETVYLIEAWEQSPTSVHHLQIVGDCSKASITE